MGKWLGLFVVSMMVLTIFLWTYLYSGMREYNKVSEKIRSLASSEQLLAENYLNGSETENRYAGLAGGILTKNSMVWIWGKQGPKIFRTDKETRYTMWSACSREIKEKMENGEPVMLNGQKYANIDEWSKQIGRGDYVEVLVAGGVFPNS